MLKVINLSLFDWRYFLSVFCTCKYAYSCSYGKWYTIHSPFALNSTHMIFELANLISIFVQMLVVQKLSLVGWRCDWGVLYTCRYENFTCSYSFGKRYTIHSLFALNSTDIISELSNLISTFVQMLVVLNLSFVDWWCDWGMFCTCECENFTYSCSYGKWYTIHSLFALNSTHMISELPNLISTFVQMLVVLKLSLVDWRCNWSVFCIRN